MHGKYFPFFLIVTCMLSNNTHAMKRSIKTITHEEPSKIIWSQIPEEIWIHIIAVSVMKNKFRTLSSYFCTLAVRKTKEILLHDQLRLRIHNLKAFAIYYTDLGEDAIVQNLLLQGANPNSQGDHRRSLIDYAAQNKNSTMLTQLLDHPHSSTYNITRGKKLLLSLTAKKDDNDNILKQLTPVSGTETTLALFHCARVNNNTLVEHEFLSDIDYKDKQKALSLATMHGSVDVVRALLANKVDPNFMSKEFHGSPLHAAARRGYTHILKLLVENGAQVNDKNFYNFTPLHSAIKEGYINSVQFLIDQGASVTIKGGNDNETSLIMAIKLGYIKIIELLLNNHADVNEKILFGETALHYAVYYNRMNIIRTLLAQPDIHINTQNNIDETALDIAFKYEQMHIAGILLDNGGKKGFAIRWKQLMQQ